MSVTVVVGPGRLSCSAPQDDVSDWAATALATVDDEFALVDEQPVAVAVLWRELFATLLDDGPALLVFPSWWSESRVTIVADAARATADDVVVQRRALLAADGHPHAVVVEIAAAFVAVIRPPDVTPVAVVPRDRGTAQLADEVSRHASSHHEPTVIDCPDGVDGATDLATALTHRLRAAGRRVTVVDDNQLMRAARPPDRVEKEASRVRFDVAASPRRRRMFTIAAGVAAAAVLVVAIVAASNATRSTPGTTLLVEGRVAVEVPKSWTPHRVTQGPGSARLQVTSPADEHAAIHVTQSPVPNAETLRDTADALRRAMADEPPGVFVEFNPGDLRAGRPAVTYREVRATHDIRWTVLLDGRLRISVGCQSAHGGEDAVAAVCERAIASVRAVTGTVAAHP